MPLSRCHDEDNARRRFFDCFQQGIERMAREHVYFVDDENLETIARGRNTYRPNDHLANIVHLRMRGGVDFLHIDRAAVRDFPARRTSSRIVCATRCRGRLLGLVTIQGLCQQPRRGRFADAARA